MDNSSSHFSPLMAHSGRAFFSSLFLCWNAPPVTVDRVLVEMCLRACSASRPGCAESQSAIIAGGYTVNGGDYDYG